MRVSSAATAAGNAGGIMSARKACDHSVESSATRWMAKASARAVATVVPSLVASAIVDGVAVVSHGTSERTLSQMDEPRMIISERSTSRMEIAHEPTGSGQRATL